MRVHLVGAGLIGKRRIANLQPDDELITISDTSEPALRNFGGQEDGFMKFSDYQMALSHVKKGDIAIICTPHNQLASIASAFADLGCHILVEKPGALSSIEIGSLTKLMGSEKVLGIGYNHRFHPGIKELVRIAESHKYGPIISIRARYGHGARKNYESEWRMVREISGGGQLMDQGSHLIDLINLLVGEFEVKNSTLANIYWQSGVEDNAVVTGSAESGALVTFNVSCTELKNLFSFEVFFKLAKVEIRGLGGSYGVETLVTYEMPDGLGIPTVTEQRFDGQDHSWQAEWRDLKGRIEGHTGVGATPPEAAAVLRQIERCYAIATR